MVGNKHAFFSAMFIENFQSIMAYTYNGALYLWRYCGESKQYKSEPVVHGHFGAVSDLDWDHSKKFIVTCSHDQTARIFTEWANNHTWHEVSRPQIHGYDINSLSCLTRNLSTDENLVCDLVSGAAEKIVRKFTPPYNLVKFLKELGSSELRYSRDKDNSYWEKCIFNFKIRLSRRRSQTGTGFDD